MKAQKSYCYFHWKKDELSEKYKKLDHSIAKSGALLSEEKIDKIVSDTRKELYDKSPDPKDNFLFDLAIHSGSEVIVSDEKKILAFPESPVPVRSLGWFKETFPIEL